MTRPLRVIDAGGTHELVTVELLHRCAYIERMGVAIERCWVTNGAEAVEALLADEADVAMQVGFGPALVAIAGGAPLRVIAGANLLTVHAIYSKAPDIRRLEDLPGRTVGVGKLGALTHQLITAALRKRDIDPASVHFVPIGNSATIFQALLADEVDAGFGETEVFHDQAHYGVHALDGGVLWEELPEFPNQASFATADAIRARRDEVVRLLAAHALLYRYLQAEESRRDYADAWAVALPDFTAEEGRVQWDFYRRHRPFAEDLLLTPERLDMLQRLNVAMGLQAAPLPFDAVADLSLARAATERISMEAE